MTTLALPRRASALVFGSLLWVSCAKQHAPEAAHIELSVAPAADAPTLIRQVGAEPGPVRRSDGSVAVIADSAGAIEVRRLGQERFLPIRNGVLYPGDQVRVLAEARATVLFADMSTVEIAEESAIAIGSRFATLDPASSAAVLSGVARFTVTPRVPGEGAFLVFTAPGMVATKGTIFTVGAFASGMVRVGVESGSIEVAAKGALSRPEIVNKDTTIELGANGELGAKTTWPRDDWGEVRARADGDTDLRYAAAVHGNALSSLKSDLTSTHAELRKIAGQLATLEASAAAALEQADEAKYRADASAAPRWIEAAFLSGLKLEWLTHAYAAHALLAAELYARHPKELRWPDYASRVDAAPLWAKRYEAVVAAVLEPTRAAYYLHHARGRANAPFVGLSVPEFFANVAPVESDERPQLAFEVYAPPRPTPMNDAHGLWMNAPTPGWYAQSRAHPAPPRGAVAFWIRPTQFTAKTLFGVKPVAEVPVRFDARPPIARAALRNTYSVELGSKLAVAPLHAGLARTARAAFISGAPLPAMRAAKSEPNDEVALEEPEAESGSKRKERSARASKRRSHEERRARKAKDTDDSDETAQADKSEREEERAEPRSTSLTRTSAKADAKLSLDL